MRELILCAAVAAVISGPAVTEMAGRDSHLALGTIEEYVHKKMEPAVLSNINHAYFCGTSLSYCLYNCTRSETRCLSARSKIGDRMCLIHGKICRYTCKNRCNIR